MEKLTITTFNGNDYISKIVTAILWNKTRPMCDDFTAVMMGMFWPITILIYLIQEIVYLVCDR